MDNPSLDKPEWLEAMSILTVQPGDVLVVKTGFVLTQEQRSYVEGAMAKKLGAPVVLLDRGLEIGVLRQAA